MSQSSSAAGGGYSAPPKTQTTGRAVLLLAVFVLIGVTLLHEVDKPATTSDTSLQATAADQASTGQAAAPVITTTTTTLVARAPSDVKVLVANGTGTSGVAAKVASKLQPDGYSLIKPGNTTNRATVSQVYFAEGYQLEAQTVAASLNLAAASVVALPTPSPIADLGGANVLVVVGPDLSASVQADSTAGGTSGTNGTSSGNSSGSNSNNSSANSTSGNSATSNPASTSAGGTGSTGSGTTSSSSVND